MPEKEIIIPPTPEILTAVDLIDKALDRLTDFTQKIEVDRLWKYESEKEALLLLGLMITDIDAYLLLAQNDLVMLPAAESIARPCFEIATRLMWMLAPNNPLEREARWIAHLMAHEDDLTEVVDFIQRYGTPGYADSTIEYLREFRIDTEEHLVEEDYEPHEYLPTLRQMLEAAGEEKLYVFYIALCQSTQGTHWATSMYHRTLGSADVLGNYIEAADWQLSFAVIWESLERSASRLLEILGVSHADWMSVDDRKSVRLTIGQINP